VTRPRLIMVDLEMGKIVKEIELDCDSREHVPDSKLGTTGLLCHNRNVYVATWDRIYVLNKDTLETTDVINDPRFSDIHGLYADADGTIWVANTNLDGLYTINNGEVKSFWHAWEEERTDLKVSNNIDYRLMTKERSPYHRYHVNGVFVTRKHVIATFLGNRYKLSYVSRLLRRLRLGRPKYFMEGGIFLIDRETRRTLKKYKAEGLHDAHFQSTGLLYFTEYFGASVLVFNIHELKVKHRIGLNLPDAVNTQYLTRGIYVHEDTMLVGHSVRRGWEISNPSAMIRRYSQDGIWDGLEIKLPGYVGIYNMIEITEGESCAT
jgi:hypothetical protein